MTEESTITISIDTAKETFSGLVATLVTHPLDLLKIRRQISAKRRSTFRIAKQIFRTEGCKTFYCGLTAGLARQFSTTATRLTVYDSLRNRYVRTNNVEPPPSRKIVIGICASMCGSVVGTPSEMVLVRRMAEGCHFLTPTGHYRCEGAPRKTIDSFLKIVREEGVLALWRGGSLALLRSATVSTIHIGCFEYLKIQEFLSENKVSSVERTLTVYTLILTHLFSALLTHPVDLLKSFYQLSKNKKDTQASIMKHLLRTRGVKGLSRGFPPYFIRMTSHAIVKFAVLERI